MVASRCQREDQIEYTWGPRGRPVPSNDSHPKDLGSYGSGGRVFQMLVRLASLGRPGLGTSSRCSFKKAELQVLGQESLKDRKINRLMTHGVKFRGRRTILGDEVPVKELIKRHLNCNIGYQRGCQYQRLRMLESDDRKAEDAGEHVPPERPTL
jgi:hypothetical protein